MYKVKTNNRASIEVDFIENGYTVNGEKAQFDCVKIGENRFHILLNNESFEAEVVSIDYRKKNIVLKINNQEMVIDVADDFDHLLVEMGIDAGASQKITELRAPMPGLVLSIPVAIGDSITTGQSLLVLEAMKMENMLPSPTDAVIAEIMVQPGSKVEKNQPLIRFE